jgi:hypothetical protein
MLRRIMVTPATVLLTINCMPMLAVELFPSAVVRRRCHNIQATFNVAENKMTTHSLASDKVDVLAAILHRSQLVAGIL